MPKWLSLGIKTARNALYQLVLHKNNNQGRQLASQLPSPLTGYAAFIHQFTERTGKAIRWLTLFMMVLMTVVVVLRYGFLWGSIALQESVLYLHAFTLMLAMAYTLKGNQHVRVDIIYRQQPEDKKNKINKWGHVLFLIPTCVFIIYSSWFYVLQSWRVMEKSQEAGGVPLVFLLKSLLIVMPVLLILQAVAELIQPSDSQNKQEL